MKRVLRLLTRPNVGGPTRQAVCLWHAHKDMGLRTLLVVGKCDPNEPSVDLAAAGIPEMTPTEVLKAGPKSEGFVVLPQLRRRPSPMTDPPALRGICRLLQGFQPQVLHSHTTKAGYLGRKAAAELKVPVAAHTFHGHVLRSYFWKPIQNLLRNMEKRLAPFSNLLFAVSPSCVRELEEIGIAAPGLIQIMPPAVATDAFTATERSAARAFLNVPEDQWLVAHVGRLISIKRVDLFLEGLNTLGGIIGHVYGSGPDSSRLGPMAPPHGQLMGLAEDLPSRLAAYDALAITSEREGCPLVGVEAFAAGVPVVGFDVPGIEDLLGPWGGGLLVPRESGAQGIADGLRRMREDNDLRAQSIAAGRDGLSRFDPATVALQLLEAYEGALGRPLR